MLRRVSLEPLEKCRAAWQASGDDVAHERLGFHDCDIRLPGNCDEIVGGVATQWPGGPEMEWNGDLMHGFAIQLKRPDAATNERARFDRSAQAHDANVIAILDLELGRNLR